MANSNNETNATTSNVTAAASWFTGSSDRISSNPDTPASSQADNVGETLDTDSVLTVDDVTSINAKVLVEDVALVDAEDAASVDAELDLKVELIELNHSYVEKRDAMEERLYHLHKVMAKANRSGQFTAFLRDDLGWTVDRPDLKAARWIARYRFRIGELTKVEYDKAMGNGKKSDTSRSTSSSQQPEATVTLPTFVQEFEVEETDGSTLLEPVFEEEEINAAKSKVDEHARDAARVFLRRILMPQGLMNYFQTAWKTQARRYGLKTFQETIVRVLLCGTKPALPDDEWGVTLDEILAEVGRNPALASERERVENEVDDVLGANAANETIDDSDVTVQVELKPKRSLFVSDEDWLLEQGFNPYAASAAGTFADNQTLDDVDALSF